MSDEEVNGRSGNGDAVTSAESEPTGRHLWDVILDGEVIGCVHACSEEAARDIIMPCRNPAMTIRPSRKSESQKTDTSSD